jgi:trans-aconitate methyltransferase
MPNTEWNASLYDQKHSFVSEYGKSLLSVLDPQAGERILDLGCGTGQLAHTISETGAQVVGIDSASTMIDVARQKYPGVDFYVMDARNFSFPEAFDAVFSNAALHWIPEPEKVVQCIASALRPGGRLVLEMGGKGNVANITTALQEALRDLAHVEVSSDWYFPSIGEYASLLEQHALEVHGASLFERPTQLADGEAGLRTWLIMFAKSMFDSFPPDIQRQALARTEQQLHPILFREGSWFADYKRLRIVAQRLP